MDKYTAVIMDIVDSRKSENRMLVQIKIKEAIAYLNEFYKDCIVKDVICGAGDEFQGLFSDIGIAYSYARRLALLVYPNKLRCGIGYGSVKYLVEDWSSTEIDGEAYYNARDAINAIPGKGSNVIFFKTEFFNDKLLNTFSLANAKVKDTQKPIARFMEIVLDFYCPLDGLNEYNDSDYEFITNVCYSFFKEYGIGALESKEKIISILKEKSFKTIDEKAYYSELLPWGIGKCLLPIVGTTQQNINQHLNNDGIKDSRSMDNAIYNFLKGER